MDSDSIVWHGLAGNEVEMIIMARGNKWVKSFAGVTKLVQNCVQGGPRMGEGGMQIRKWLNIGTVIMFNFYKIYKFSSLF